jgi:hypothetical protein
MKAGDRFKLIQMGSDPDPVPPGSTGTIDGIIDMPSFDAPSGRKCLNVTWDPGVNRSLHILVPDDRIIILEDT